MEISKISIVILMYVISQWLQVNSIVDDDFITGSYKKAAISTSSQPCAEIAKKILQKKGTAVDAAISAMICEGATNPQGSGIGGGFVMTYYNRTARKAHVNNAMDCAPAQASHNMYGEHPPTYMQGLSVAIPGAMRGYWKAYNMFGGGVPWKFLFKPTIRMCEQGITVNKNFAWAMQSQISQEYFNTNAAFNSTFKSLMNQQLKYGDTYKHMKLAETLKHLANTSGDNLYTEFHASTIGDYILVAVQSYAGILTQDDLKNYQPRVEEPFETNVFDKMTIYTATAPSSGPIVAYILKLVDGLLPASSELLNTRRITEAMKYAFAARTKLGDPQYANITNLIELITSEENIKKIRESISDTRTYNYPSHYGGDFTKHTGHGTTNVAIISENGDAVVATSSINYLFGSGIMAYDVGIILNDHINSFVHPNVDSFIPYIPSQANFVVPNKIPISWAAPTIITDKKGNVRLIIGAAQGQSRIISAIANTVIRSLVFKEYIERAASSMQFHHPLNPMHWLFYSNTGISQEIIDGMKSINHDVWEASFTDFPAITAIERRNGVLRCLGDFRSAGVAGYSSASASVTGQDRLRGSKYSWVFDSDFD